MLTLALNCFPLVKWYPIHGPETTGSLQEVRSEKWPMRSQEKKKMITFSYFQCFTE